MHMRASIAIAAPLGACLLLVLLASAGRTVDADEGTTAVIRGGSAELTITLPPSFGLEPHKPKDTDTIAWWYGKMGASKVSAFVRTYSRKEWDFHDPGDVTDTTAWNYREGYDDADKRFAEAYNNLGLCLTELGEHEDATVAFETAVEIDPDLAAGYNNLGYVLFKQNHFEAAIEMYKEAIEAARSGLKKGGLKPADSAQVILGMALFEEDRLDSAMAQFREAGKDKRSRKMANQWIQYLNAEKDRRRQLAEALAEDNNRRSPSAGS